MHRLQDPKSSRPLVPQVPPPLGLRSRHGPRPQVHKRLPASLRNQQQEAKHLDDHRQVNPEGPHRRQFPLKTNKNPQRRPLPPLGQRHQQRHDLRIQQTRRPPPTHLPMARPRRPQTQPTVRQHTRQLSQEDSPAYRQQAQ